MAGKWRREGRWKAAREGSQVFRMGRRGRLAQGVEAIAVEFQPPLGIVAVRAMLQHQPPEADGVVHLTQMGHLMGGDIVEHKGWGQD